MPRNLIVCFDGTNNEFGPENTNVIRLIQALDRDENKQLLYYDPGVGTMPEPGLRTRIAAKLSQVGGLAIGTGLERNVEEGYNFLMETWEPGDRVFLFGFSRGSYTARVLAGMLHAVGLIPRANQNMLPYAIRLYKAIRAELRKEAERKRKGQAPKAGESRYQQLLKEFRWTFARPTPQSPDERHFHVHFEGVWDTVSSVGWVWDPATYPYTAWNPSVGIIRHAISIDERRWFFRQNQVTPARGQNFQEYWFAGVHSDVGGGYPEADGGLWRPSFEWMLNEAVAAGLAVDPGRLQAVLNRTPPPANAWAEPAHNSLTPKWWVAEIVPKMRWSFKKQRPQRWPSIGRWRRRYIPQCSWIHPSALHRIRHKDASGRYVYSPSNLSRTFLDRVRQLPAVPPQGLQTDGKC